jgi:hypothetical protein
MISATARVLGFVRDQLDDNLAEAVDQLQGKSAADIADDGKVHGQILAMADALTTGIVRFLLEWTTARSRTLAPEAESLPDALAVAFERGLILAIRTRRGPRQPNTSRTSTPPLDVPPGQDIGVDTPARAPALTQRVPYTEEGRRLCARNAVARRPAPHPTRTN